MKAVATIFSFDDDKTLLKKGFVRESLNDILGAEAVREIRKGGQTIQQALKDEQQRLLTIASEIELARDLDERENPKPETGKRTATNGGSQTSSFSGKGFDAFKQRQEDLDALKQQNDALREAQALFEATRTPAEEYKATLEAIATIEQNNLLLDAAGGTETVMRARADAIVEYANATGDAEAAMQALGEQAAKGNLDLETTTQTYIRINEELGIQEKRIQAAIDAQEEAQRLSDAERDKLLDKVDAQALVVEQELILARLNGDTTEIERLEREIELLREKAIAIRNGATEGEADKVAETLVEDRDFAEMQGKMRDAFKNGIRTAIKEKDLKAGLSSLFDGIADNMFDRAIDTLSDGLFNLLSGLFQSGGSGGGLAGLFGGAGGGLSGGLGGGVGGVLGSVFAGFFNTGGNIPAGKFGVVGDGPNGDMRFAELISGPATVTPLKAMFPKPAEQNFPSPSDTGPSQTTVNKYYTISGVADVDELKKIIRDGDAATLNEVPAVVSKANQRQRRASPR